jgi:hypothetical protein
MGMKATCKRPSLRGENPARDGVRKRTTVISYATPQAGDDQAHARQEERHMMPTDLLSSCGLRK